MNNETKGYEVGTLTQTDCFILYTQLSYMCHPALYVMAVRDAFVPILTLILGLELDKSSSPLTPISLEWNYGAPPPCSTVLTFLSSRTKGSNSSEVCGYVIICLACIGGGLSKVRSKPYTSRILRSGHPVLQGSLKWYKLM